MSPALKERDRRRIRVGYVSGPSDADRIYEDLKSDNPPSYFGTNYMRQFLLLMEEIDAEALIETWHGDESYQRRIGHFVFNNVARHDAGGLRYHVARAINVLGMLWRFLKFRPDVIVLTGDQEYWWLLAPLRFIGTRFIASFHCVLWPPFQPVRSHYKFLLSLNRQLILRHLTAAVSTSGMITRQFLQLIGRKASRIPLYEHLPTWSPNNFNGIDPVNRSDRTPFSVMFMGRMERNKGIYDLVRIADDLNSERPGEFEFHLCGDGTALQDLGAAVREKRLSHIVHVHGYCAPARMRQVLSSCHVVVVPTRSDFAAGFEMTCAEAILSGRPLVTSAVAPALEYVGEASIEVPPDDTAAYKEAIVRLKDDRELYAAKLRACSDLRDQFFAYERSWDHAMRLAFADLPVRSC